MAELQLDSMAVVLSQAGIPLLKGFNHDRRSYNKHGFTDKPDEPMISMIMAMWHVATSNF